jgi:Asp-tRNA(Asn)/Glu-tRNA(Gln) amidotransferase A subunit family amidase
MAVVTSRTALSSSTSRTMRSGARALSAAGLPIGVQLAAGFGSDADLLGFAAWFAAQPGWMNTALPSTFTG